MMKNFRVSYSGLCGLILIAASTLNCIASYQNNNGELRHTHVMRGPSHYPDNDRLKHTHVIKYLSNCYDNNRLMQTHVMGDSINRCEVDKLKHTHIMVGPVNRCPIRQPNVMTDCKNPGEGDPSQITIDGFSDSVSTCDEDHFKKDLENVPQQPRYVSFFVGCKLKDIIDAPVNLEVASFSTFSKLGSL